MAVWSVKQGIEGEMKEGVYSDLGVQEGDMVAVEVRVGP